MNRKTREELNALSKKVFGSSSKWQKIVNQGVAQPYERDRKVMIPKANGQLEEKVFTERKFVVEHMTVEQVRAKMEQVLVDRAKPSKFDADVGVIETGPINPDDAFVSYTANFPDGETLVVSNEAFQALKEDATR